MLHKFATEEYPLHASQVPDFMLCPWKIVMKFLDQADRTHRNAADTGSAMHKAASAWHKNGKEVEEALAEMRACREEYPMADLHEAGKMFQQYIAHPRVQEMRIIESEIHLFQEKVDPQTGEKFVFEGTADLLIEGAEGEEIWDLKTSKKQGSMIRDDFTYQLVVYSYLASKARKKQVLPGGIIMLRTMEFFPYFINKNQVQILMEAVCERIRFVRSGGIVPVPGDHCGYCVGIHSCLDRLEGMKL